MSISHRRVAAAAAASTFVTALLTAGAAQAHSTNYWPVAGSSLKMGWSANGKKTKFQFKTKKQVNINPVSIVEDPREEGATLAVIGGGTQPGNSGVIHLAPNLWTPIGSEDAPTGWRFQGDPYNTKGVSKIQIKAGRTDGSLQIQAKEEWWPFDITAPQESVQVVLTIGTYTFCAEFSADREAVFKVDEAGAVQASASLAPTECPAVCGNGITDPGEQCDDGNNVDNDTCTNTCEGCNPSGAEYASTYDGIQDILFQGYGCTNDACHGSAAEGGLDLRAGASHADLVNVASAIDPNVARVFPGDQDLSMLYLKIAEKTLGSAVVNAPGSAMPVGGSTVSEDHLEALRLWIRGGAPETGVVAGTAQLLGSCLPPPTPLDIPQPPVPDPSVGTQLAMPGYLLESGREVEGCVATYYDVSATVPPSMMVDCPGMFPGTNETGLNAGKCFSYQGNALYQDAQSHHSIVDIYPGEYNWNDPGWGPWTCYGGPTNGATCDPSVANVCGTGGVCGGRFHHGVACLDTITDDWGAPDYNNSEAPQFSGSQESTANFHFPNGVYAILPLKGLVLWNSHAFNLTGEDTEMEAWINMTYTDQRNWPAVGLFESQWNFTHNVPVFEQREYCATLTFPEGTHLFQLSSHTHKRGIRWRYYQAPQTPCVAPGAFVNPACTPGHIDDVFYESYDYSDPLTLNADPIHVYSGTTEDRTIKFCALFDNGFTDPAHVKTQSGSPQPTGNLIVGGPCSNAEVRCMGGVNKGQLCSGNDLNCPGSTCDACPLKGGVTTEDEMFLPLGTYYVVP